MIAGGDDVARSAFWLSLREQPSSPSLVTQELDPADILEVRDVAEAIARVDAVVRAKRPSEPELPDLFEGLGNRPTDDASGPAVAAEARPSSVPPPPDDEALVDDAEVELVEAEASSSALIAQAAPAAPSPRPPILHLPTSVVTATAGPEDDAFYHPGGRIRSFADVTLDGRAEPTLLVRLRARRSRLTWVVAGLVVLLSTFTTGALLAPEAEAEVPRTAPQASRTREAPTRIGWRSSHAKLATLGGRAPAASVLDVRNLPRAR